MTGTQRNLSHQSDTIGLFFSVVPFPLRHPLFGSHPARLFDDVGWLPAALSCTTKPRRLIRKEIYIGRDRKLPNSRVASQAYNASNASDKVHLPSLLADKKVQKRTVSAVFLPLNNLLV